MISSKQKKFNPLLNTQFDPVEWYFKWYPSLQIYRSELFQVFKKNSVCEAWPIEKLGILEIRDSA